MQALLVVDAQNEFSPEGRRAVPGHAKALETILARVEPARRELRPIAFIIHHNLPHESPAFIPGTWGAQLSPGLAPRPGSDLERRFEKTVFGAFSVPDLEPWLRSHGIDEILIVGFSTHMCVSTTSREALVLGFNVLIDPNATGTCDIEDDTLGRQTADEVRRSALLHLVHMGARLSSPLLPAAR